MRLKINTSGVSVSPCIALILFLKLNLVYFQSDNNTRPLTFIHLVHVQFYVCSSRDYYDILNVPRTAKQNQIKSAFRKMAKHLHPDKNRDDPDAAEKFSQLRNAYEVLSNSDLRKDYDRCGEECVKRDTMPSGHDPFASFFGDFGFHFDESPGQKEIRKGGTITLDLSVSLEELYNGNFVQVNKLVYRIDEIRFSIYVHIIKC